ncbi:CbiX/SirB N-terminal domain-containing protein [Frigidibacter sp.]|uniref:CbiX/SirB N-terminal domain-containing protein n=1 Tax=Frigidibacter sp. TaxID=2586418 RepID=UPI002736C458|nr:CbiX/SirB N-terminal domain-containing protein [Frigidibacter sp.]MDP3339987.1 CbiX/SirB N-terminal domain-containing protein [Frigidibacter sp.]
MKRPLSNAGGPEPESSTALHRALIVAHGQPSDPGPAEAALARFAERVAVELPADWHVEAATLAASGALEAALAKAGANSAPLLIYPMFIADGWFTQVNLPARLRAAGVEVVQRGSGMGSGEEAAGGGNPERAGMPGDASAHGEACAASPSKGLRDQGVDTGCLETGGGSAHGTEVANPESQSGPGRDGGGGAEEAGPKRPAADGAKKIAAMGARDPALREAAPLPADAAPAASDGTQGGQTPPRFGLDAGMLPTVASGAPDPLRPAAAALPGNAASPANDSRRGAQILPPFGLDPGILTLALLALRAALAEHGLRAAETNLIIAAHGSFKSPAPAAVARRLARAIIAEMPFAEMRTAFIDQAPRIADFARGLPAPALCLPLFAAAGGHVEDDLPAALAEAEFAGHILAPLGLAAGAPGLVAAALLAASGRE